MRSQISPLRLLLVEIVLLLLLLLHLRLVHLLLVADSCGDEGTLRDDRSNEVRMVYQLDAGHG